MNVDKKFLEISRRREVCRDRNRHTHRRCRLLLGTENQTLEKFEKFEVSEFSAPHSHSTTSFPSDSPISVSSFVVTAFCVGMNE